MFIFVGFYDIGCDIGFGKINWWNAWFYWVWWDFYLEVWFLSLYVDEVAYRLPGKQNICSGFCRPLFQKVGFFPFYRKSNICFVLDLEWQSRFLYQYNNTIIQKTISQYFHIFIHIVIHILCKTTKTIHKNYTYFTKLKNIYKKTCKNP